ncbi:RNA helicase [Polyrhizophydium stewartii]|uniref:RNA helicase n=1 Tax=Polyrhizophydium stewartii TaxID=2732419 RepID=A0ABR4NGY6_9FUNG
MPPSAPTGKAHEPSRETSELQSAVDEEGRIVATQRPLIEREFGGYLKVFARSAELRDKCVGLGISSDVFDLSAQEFRKALLDDQLPWLSKEDAMLYYAQDGKHSRCARMLFPQLLKFIMLKHPSESKQLSLMLESTDMQRPSDWYPEARQIKRRIIMHIGPTNSGKTYAALQRFKDVERSIYCGPLRLLAHEVYHRMNTSGIGCNLITGEERRESDNICRLSCTVEMTSLSRDFDVAVIDEIQMIGDDQRGWAWTQALLGLRAPEIHLCGEETAIGVVRKLLEGTDDTIEINRYERLTPLSVMNRSLNSEFRKIERGDAFIVFSRRGVFEAKNLIERATGQRTAIIYGGLPPETRAEQAKLFNDPDSDHRILVATDAIGMGLNLNIRRVVLSRLAKFNGTEIVPLTISQTKQIAGRAGRFKTAFEKGLVTTFDPRDLKLLHAHMRLKAPKILSAGVAPTFEQIEGFSKSFPGASLSQILSRFEELAQIDGNYFMCNLKSQRIVAELINNIPMNLRDRYSFVSIPCEPENKVFQDAIIKLAWALGESRTISLSEVLPDMPDLTSLKGGVSNVLKDMELRHKLIIMYLWLSMRFPATFADTEPAMAEKARSEIKINELLLTRSHKKAAKAGQEPKIKRLTPKGKGRRALAFAESVSGLDLALLDDGDDAPPRPAASTKEIAAPAPVHVASRGSSPTSADPERL